MFLTPLDETVKRLGAEVLFQEQLIAKYRQELEAGQKEMEKLQKLNAYLSSKVEIVGEIDANNGYKLNGADEAQGEGSAKDEGLSG
jgi:uncharacterized coiled-coil protein SlyX